MAETSNSQKESYNIFVSYAGADKTYAKTLTDKLSELGLSVWFDEYELKPSDSIIDKIGQAISTSDYFIVLLSNNSVQSKWVQFELGTFLTREFTTRDITLLPIIIDDCEIPEILASRKYLDLRTNFDEGVNQLAQEITFIPYIDFKKLNGELFEQLTIDLLNNLGFTEIQRISNTLDRGFDLSANYSRLDPFGIEIKEYWLIETKHYQSSRASLRTIRTLSGSLSVLSEKYQGLLITNSQLTSAAREWLEHIRENKGVKIQIIDSTDLKRLLLRNHSLITKYFINKVNGQVD